MANLTVAETNDYLLKDGKPFFYLADTVWAAFANLSVERWEAYLRYRRAQGFNAIQISIDTPAGPTVEEMLPSLQLIQESTPIVITGPVTQAELDLLKDSLKPSGLCLDLFLQ